MERQILCIVFILWLAVMIAAPSVMAASFDLLLKGHWAYRDLALLADVGLLEEYSSEKELAAVFPLTRYEVALLVGEVLSPKVLNPWQADISADMLMWEIMGNNAKDGEIDLSYEVVAKARQDSESVYRVLARLTQEFGKELNALGLTGKWPKTSPFSLAAPTGIIPKKVLASLGVTQLLGTTPSGFAGANGYTLSDGLRREVVPLTTSRLVYTVETEKKTKPVKNAAQSRFGEPDERIKDTYEPVEIASLFDQSIQAQALIVENEVEGTEEQSLKLRPYMNGGRPLGLLTSYFLDRTDN